MISSIQRISSATVTIVGINIVEIDNGLLALFGTFKIDMKVSSMNDITIIFTFKA